MRSSIALSAVAAVALALPGAASASTVKSTNPGVPYSTVLFTGTSNPSDVTLNYVTGGDLAFTDAAQTLTAGAGCLAGTPVVCPQGPADVRFGNADDRFNGWSFQDITATGNGGRDTLIVSGSRTDVSGGDGADVLDLGSNGKSTGRGGEGDDSLRATHGNATYLYGNIGDDLIVGHTPEEYLYGNDGSDRIFLSGTMGTVDAGAGDDVVVRRPWGQYPGKMTLLGGPGRDVIVGNFSLEAIDAGGGDDAIDVSGDANRGGAAAYPDTVECGGGTDTVWVDPTDSVSSTCEEVLPGPMPAHAGVAEAFAELYEVFPDEVPAT